MKIALTFLLLTIAFGYLALAPAAILPKPFGLWVSIPLLFASVFASFGLAMKVDEGRLRSLKAVAEALKEGKDIFFSWAIYMAALVGISGAIALLAWAA
ncbi:MAG: hypothetical protein [Podoviridae sp. ctdb7]|nr:MAG: hypothetical protein [Podoviridae sp. ctdb7]